MQFHDDFREQNSRGLNRISSYGPGFFAINETRLEASVALTPQGECVVLAATSLDELGEADLAGAIAHKPDIILLGTGARHQFAPPALAAVAASSGIALEAMNTGAACRTYNVLASEGRAVAAILLRLE